MSTKKKRAPTKQKSKRTRRASLKERLRRSPEATEALARIRDVIGRDVFASELSEQLRSIVENVPSIPNVSLASVDLPLATFRELESVRTMLGVDDFAANVGGKIRELMKGWEDALASTSGILDRVAATMLAAGRSVERAEAGDIEEICRWLERDPLETLQIEGIIGHIEERRWQESRKARTDLRAVVKAFRKGILRPIPGRPPDRDRSTIAPMVLRLNTIHETAPAMRHAYRNPALREQDARHVRAYFEEQYGGPLASKVGQGVQTVLSQTNRRGKTPVRTSRAFAVEVAAKVSGYSTRNIRLLVPRQKK